LPNIEQIGNMTLDALIATVGQLTATGMKQSAMDLYQAWLETTSSPLKFVAMFNLGVLYGSEKDYTHAKALYEEALKINSGLIQARLNLGTALEQLGCEDEALEQWRIALQSKEISTPDNISLQLHALNNLGRLLEVRRQFKPSLQMLEKSLSIDPTQKDVMLHLIHLRQKMCEWPIHAAPKGVNKDDLVRGTSPLAMLSASDDPEMQRAASKRFVDYKFDFPVSESLAASGGYRHDRIKVGYLSSDLSTHAVSLLTVELFERHDRSRFEVYGFCWSKEDGTAFRQRVVNAFDCFVRIGGMDDKEAAECIRSHEIDILVDLHGLTSGARPMILCYRPAPVQMTYLGFPGTTGFPWIDYVICDRYLIPSEEAKYYSEKPLYLNRCFQASDSKRQVGAMPKRADYSLPEDAFVYCSFNNNYKYTQEMFAAWMHILKQVPKSVLWLLADNEWAKDNLCREARKNGIKKDRLIFAPRVMPADYLARYQLADLFLDTHPFNGGTTANDALFMGLPLLTLSGRTFASRMAGSLLTNLELPELITHGLQEYKNKAIALARNKNEYMEIKNRLDRNRISGTVFNMAEFVADYEKELSGVLLQPIPETVQRHKKRDVRLYMTAYSQETLAQVKGGFLLLDNLQNPRPDWMEYWPIRHYLNSNTMENGCLYGFFSPKFSSKTGLAYAGAIAFIADCHESVDVVTFSPQPDMGALFLNVFEQGETFDPGFKSIAQELFDSIGLGVDLDAIIMDSRHIVFSNYFVADRKFWLEWLEICEKIFAICEAGSTKLAQDLCLQTSYGSGVQRKVFVIERIASLMLSSNRWKVRPYDTFKCAWSGTPLNTLKHEAILCDALKLAYNELQYDEYKTAFSEMRRKLFFKS
jgi:predicted O-linked N-acetylglucosamine transferase (SPINDLY family)